MKQMNTNVHTTETKQHKTTHHPHRNRKQNNAIYKYTRILLYNSVIVERTVRK